MVGQIRALAQDYTVAACFAYYRSHPICRLKALLPLPPPTSGELVPLQILCPHFASTSSRLILLINRRCEMKQTHHRVRENVDGRNGRWTCGRLKCGSGRVDGPAAMRRGVIKPTKEGKHKLLPCKEGGRR